MERSGATVADLFEEDRISHFIHCLKEAQEASGSWPLWGFGLDLLACLRHGRIWTVSMLEPLFSTWNYSSRKSGCGRTCPLFRGRHARIFPSAALVISRHCATLSGYGGRIQLILLECLSSDSVMLSRPWFNSNGPFPLWRRLTLVELGICRSPDKSLFQCQCRDSIAPATAQASSYLFREEL
ncbi:hypothetical protein, variant [Cladophialophora immunda]|uniref:Uncharacterized protein n=1 Tax=Cladophialophora immunda TaxID=569365 RepID=A0A0D2ATY1_9EURO|nr:uncharacterized protein PV07_08319 [Cladophialophora immunda]XP_016248894.1 hypothetical protein, variant [Cladophialophora immunda]KIW28677.1 hypothetical protein PV07_08319 [Cladophialophora immunda]KIW28678.1 hypothetical protein, variant [Cladophialophora immunda]